MPFEALLASKPQHNVLNLLQHDAVWPLCRFTRDRAAAAEHDLATMAFNGLDETNFHPDWCAYCLYVRRYACTGHSLPLVLLHPPGWRA